MGKLIPTFCRQPKPSKGGGGVADLQIELPEGVHGVLMPLFRCLRKPNHRLNGVGLH